ncbi:MAG: shikimate kinase [Lachnospiraceae bacterium]|nr:shikimate kinase [Lachnospiraceae bacterium]
MNYILIGLPGSGKSTVGVMLAKYIGYGFMDADLAIQAQEKKLLSEIIEEKGTEGFIEVENRVLSQIVVDRCVIATGGSAIYSGEAMQHLKESGKCIYLKMSYEEMEKRLGGTFRRRGVVLRNGSSSHNMYEERVPLYEKYADITIDEQDLTAEQTLVKLLQIIQN